MLSYRIFIILMYVQVGLKNHNKRYQILDSASESLSNKEVNIENTVSWFSTFICLDDHDAKKTISYR